MTILERLLWWVLALFGLVQLGAYLRERHRLKWLAKLDPVKAWIAETGAKAAKQAGAKAQEKLVELAGMLGVAGIVGGVAALGIGSATLTLNADLRTAFVSWAFPDEVRHPDSARQPLGVTDFTLSEQMSPVNIRIHSTDPSASVFVFQSDWSTATGTTDAALRDTDNDGWTVRTGDTYEEVVTVASLPGNAPPAETTGNAIRYEYTQDGSDAQMYKSLDGVLAIGQDYYIRYYTRVDGGVHSSGNAHYEVTDVFQYRNITFNSPDADGNGSHYFPTMRTEGGPEATFGDDDYNFARWRGGYDPVGDTVRSDENLLQDGEWYRFEFFVDFLGDSINNPGPAGGPTGGTIFRTYGSWTDEGADCEFRIYPRIYDSSGTLIMDADDYGQDEFGSGPTNSPNGNTWSLQEYYDEGGTFLCIPGVGGPDPGYTAVRRFGIGNNGSDSGSPPASDGSQYWYHMNYAVSTEGWIGAN